MGLKHGVMASGCSVEAVKKARADTVFLAERRLFPSRSAAAGAVRSGEVGWVRMVLSRYGRASWSSPGGANRRPGAPLCLARGIKLENALEALAIDVPGDCADVGASIGGFVDCLLQRGAARVGGGRCRIRRARLLVARNPRWS